MGWYLQRIWMVNKRNGLYIYPFAIFIEPSFACQWRPKTIVHEFKLRNIKVPLSSGPISLKEPRASVPHESHTWRTARALHFSCRVTIGSKKNTAWIVFWEQIKQTHYSYHWKAVFLDFFYNVFLSNWLFLSMAQLTWSF